ncbi:MAG: exo-alpha-sialidase [Bacteroidales bacterium]|nr:exo-alpha-sialidase [Bacteroidales bacterium]
MKKIILASVFYFSITILSMGQKTVPGMVVGHSHPDTKIYLGSPSILIMDVGTYIASYQQFGPGFGKKNLCYTFIVESKDRGKSWKRISSIRGLFWANLFTFRGELYIFGTQMQDKGGYGPLVIRKSTDQGKTWTNPVDEEHGLLRVDQEYHTAPVPMIIHNGRIFRAVEDRNPPEQWGVNFRSLVISAPLDADLMKAASWTTSNRLRYNQEWLGRAWLEGNLVVTSKDDIVNILRNDFRPEGGQACIIKVSKYGEKVSFNPETGFIDFPGGCKKFTIRYDAVSDRYWSLTNFIPEEYKGGNPERTRNTLTLISSKDLRSWEVNKIVLQHPDVTYVGFQYADWRFDGDDLITLVRTAFPEPDGTNAHNCHDSNYIIFYRVENFRDFQSEIRK